MSSSRHPETVYIGLVSDEPMRLEGLISIFDQPAVDGKTCYVTVTGTLPEIIARPAIEYLVLDMHDYPEALAVLESIRRERPYLHVVVIGPEGNDEMVMAAIIAGARAFLELNADADMVQQAIDVVTSGSIWAPRRLLSKLIDRLLKLPETNLSKAHLHLTDREKQVLELILLARSNREIARELGIEERTVKAHVGRLMRKTGADNRIELTMRALNRPLLPRARPRTQDQEEEPK
jgi:DNA-binding NarL/FixJ family response regulator